MQPRAGLRGPGSERQGADIGAVPTHLQRVKVQLLAVAVHQAPHLRRALVKRACARAAGAAGGAAALSSWASAGRAGCLPSCFGVSAPAFWRYKLGPLTAPHAPGYHARRPSGALCPPTGTRNPQAPAGQRGQPPGRAGARHKRSLRSEHGLPTTARVLQAELALGMQDDNVINARMQPHRCFVDRGGEGCCGCGEAPGEAPDSAMRLIELAWNLIHQQHSCHAPIWV